MVEVYSGGPVRVEKRFPHLTDWIQTVIMSGRRLLVKDWKAPNAPALSLWASSLGQLAAYERLSYRLFNKSGRVRIKVGHTTRCIRLAWCCRRSSFGRTLVELRHKLLLN